MLKAEAPCPDYMHQVGKKARLEKGTHAHTRRYKEALDLYPRYISTLQINDVRNALNKAYLSHVRTYANT